MSFSDIDGFILIAIGAWLGYTLRGWTPDFKRQTNEFRDQQSREMLQGLSLDAREKIQEALADNRRIEAIKIFRKDTNLGLKDAKFCVEYLLENGPSVFEKS